MRKYLIGFTVGVLLALPIGIFADNISNIGKKIDSEFTVKFDGEELPVKAIGIDGTSYAPLRATGEALGLNVDFVDRTVILESKNEGDEADVPEVNGGEKELEPQTEQTLEEKLEILERQIEGIRTAIASIELIIKHPDASEEDKQLANKAIDDNNLWLKQLLQQKTELEAQLAPAK